MCPKHNVKIQVQTTIFGLWLYVLLLNHPRILQVTPFFSIHSCGQNQIYLLLSGLFCSALHSISVPTWPTLFLSQLQALSRMQFVRTVTASANNTSSHRSAHTHFCSHPSGPFHLIQNTLTLPETMTRQ